MLAQGSGRIINTASMASLLVPHPQKQIAYNASKAAVVKITETLGAEWADRGITVNCMSPGIVNTALIQVRPVSTILDLEAGYDALMFTHRVATHLRMDFSARLGGRCCWHKVCRVQAEP